MQKNVCLPQSLRRKNGFQMCQNQILAILGLVGIVCLGEKDFALSEKLLALSPPSVLAADQSATDLRTTASSPVAAAPSENAGQLQSASPESQTLAKPIPAQADQKPTPQGEQKSAGLDDQNPAAQKPAGVSESKELFDGRRLTGWKVLQELAFKRHGKVEVRDGQIVLGRGEPFTGICWTGPFPRCQYEVMVEACRLEGDDFFCGLVFPVDKADCSLVVGGWGGTIVGLSNIDGEPAAENETAASRDFQKGRWYAIRLRVTEQKVQVWIDQEKVIDFAYPDRQLSIRWDQEPMRPFGICTWQTTGAVRKVTLRRLGQMASSASSDPSEAKPEGSASAQPSGEQISGEPTSGEQKIRSPSEDSLRLPSEPGASRAFEVPKTFDGSSCTARIELEKIERGFRLYRLVYPSPIETPVVENNTIPAEYYVPEGIETGPPRTAVMVLHILNGNYELERLLCRTLALRGIPSVMFKLPYYDERAPAGGRRRLLQEPALFVQALRQAVADCRRTIDVLSARPEVDPTKVSLAGISLGGIVGATAAAQDSRVHRAALILAGGDLLSIIRHCREARAIDQFLQSLPTERRQELEQALEGIDPVRHAGQLRDRAQAGRVLMVNADQDEVIPRRCTEKLADGLGMADRVIWLEGLGHYTAIAALPQTLAQATAFFAQDLPAEVKPPAVAESKAEDPLQKAAVLARQLGAILLKEPAEGKCHLLDISADVVDPSGKKYQGRIRWIRGVQHRFRLELKVAGLPEVETGQGDRPWLASAQRVFVGRGKDAQPRMDPLAFVPARHQHRAKAWAAAVQGLLQMPSLLESFVEAELVQEMSEKKQSSEGKPSTKPSNEPEQNPAKRPAISSSDQVILLRQKDRRQNSIRLVLTPEDQPRRVEFSVDHFQGTVTVHGWQQDAPAPEPLFQPPDRAIQEVDPEDLVRIWSGLVEFLMEKTE